MGSIDLIGREREVFVERFREYPERRKKCQDVAEEVVRRRVKKQGRLRGIRRKRKFS